jgi:hypothetical protein
MLHMLATMQFYGEDVIPFRGEEAIPAGTSSSLVLFRLPLRRFRRAPAEALGVFRISSESDSEVLMDQIGGSICLELELPNYSARRHASNRAAEVGLLVVREGSTKSLRTVPRKTPKA